MTGEDFTEPIRVNADRRRAEEQWLALASAGIESRIDSTPEGSAVVVRAAERARAEAVLAAFDTENQPPPQLPPDPFEPSESRAGLVVAVLLCAFFVVTGPRDAGSSWFALGDARALRIAAGELWRTVTALTLHADFGHIASNAATLIIFGSALCGLVGPGVGVWLMLLSGAGGNWLTAALRGASHSAVGASTGIFGSLGALAAIQLVRRRRGTAVSAWRAAAPLAAGLALLGFLGTSPQSDVLAHLFGFAIGVGLGVLVTRFPTLRAHQRLQAALAVGAALVVIACWLLACSG